MNLYPIKNILVPVDLSESSLNALKTAIYIARMNKATLLLLNIEEPEYTLVNNEKNPYMAGQSNADTLKKLGSDISFSHNVTVELLWQKGNVTECIINTALSEKAELVIMGAHGESGYREGFAGTNTYNVCKYSTVPVLIIPSKQKITEFKNVLLPVCSTEESVLNYGVALQLLSQNSILEILGLCEQKDNGESKDLDKIAAEIKDIYDDDITIHTSWSMGNTISGDIFRSAQLKNAELIVVTPALDSITRTGFIGPQVQRIINSSQAPVLSIKMVEVPEHA